MDTEIIPFVTDMTYGGLMFVAIAAALFTDMTALSVGFLIGICFGYALHVGSNMAGFTTVADTAND